MGLGWGKRPMVMTRPMIFLAANPRPTPKTSVRFVGASLIVVWIRWSSSETRRSRLYVRRRGRARRPVAVECVWKHSGDVLPGAASEWLDQRRACRSPRKTARVV